MCRDRIERCGFLMSVLLEIALTAATKPVASAEIIEHARHPALLGTREIVEIPGKSEHGIACKGIRAINRESGWCIRSRLVDIHVLVQYVKNRQSDFAILFLEQLLGDAWRKDRCTRII